MKAAYENRYSYKPRYGRKYYRAVIRLDRSRRVTRKRHKTASAAVEYGLRLAARFNRMAEMEPEPTP